MQAFVVRPEPRLMDIPEPDLHPGEAIVRVLLAGICGTDLEILAGYKGSRVLGHEMVGIVEVCEDEPWIGRRVVSEINIGCGRCSRCRGGLARHCERRQVLGLVDRDGVFAERVAVPVANLHEVPETIEDELAVWTEPLAAALAVWDAGMEPGDDVLVLGDGRLGALIALGLGERGACVRVVGKHREKLQRLEALGLETIDGPPEPVFACVVEATGSPEGAEAARAWVRPRGTLVLKSTMHGKVSLDLSRVVVDELRLVGSRCGDFAPALELLARGGLPLKELVSAVYPLAEAPAALAHAARPDAFKVLLKPNPG